MLGLPIVYEAAHEKIELPVIVVIEPDGAGRPAGHRQTRFLSDIRKGAVPIISIKNCSSKTGDKEVGKTVIVVIAHRHAHAERATRNAGFLCDVGKRAVA